MSLVKNSIYNIVGFAIPTIFAIPCLGILSRWLSMEEFGLFTLSFAILGYASIFDGGLSRAVTREIAIYRNNNIEKIKIIGTSNFFIFIFSLIASLSLFIFADNLADFLKVSSLKYDLVVDSFKLLSISIPLYLFNLIWIGYLEGVENFFIVNLQKSIGNTLIVLFPVLFCMYEKNIFFAFLGIFIGRLISFLITLFICRIELIRSKLKIDKFVAVRLFKFGGWITVSNLVSPLMVHMDKIIVSNILGANKVSAYSAPAEGVSRLVNVPIAITKVLFPKISAAKTLKEQKELETKSYIIIALICAPIVVICYVFAKEIMAIWMGEAYGVASENVFKILIIGFYFNALAQIPYTILQSKGFSKYTAYIHLLEVVPFLVAVYFATEAYGLIGAALVWSARVCIDLILLLFLNYKMRSILINE